MKELYRDKRFFFIIMANLLSSVGSGITMITIPWLLISNEQSGALFFGYATITMTLLNFIMAPFIGQWVDKFSRKKLLMLGELIGFTCIIAFAISGFLGLEYGKWHYLLLYATGSFYYNLFYPGMFALNQEIFPKSVYKSLNGAMEIQGQLSSVIAGAIAAILIGKIDLEWILLLDATTYLGAFYIFWNLPYKSLKNMSVSSSTISFWVKLTEGYRFIKGRPILFLFLMASFMPFIGVMVTNYLFPLFLADVLNAEGAVYGAQSMLYGIGAVIAGLIIPILSSKIGNKNTIVLTVLLYTISITIITFLASIPVYLLITVFLAFGNAGTRVARNSYLMDTIPNDIIGRVDSLFRTIGLGIRVVLLILFMYFNTTMTIQYSLILLSGILILSFAVVFLLRKLSIGNKDNIISNGIGQN